jgi:hypothetical protein
MKKTGVILFLLFLSMKGNAQTTYQFYYLSVGCGNYEHRPEKFSEPDFIPFDDLPEAVLSAKLMQGLFKKYVHAKGQLVVSTGNRFITRQRLFDNLQLLQNSIKKDRAKKPFIILYYCGHGISENMGWNQFLIPGNYTAIPGNKNFEELMQKLIFLGDITDFFLKRKYEYMVLIDCCRKEGKDSSLPEKRLSYFFDRQNIETFKTVAAGLKYLNEYHQAKPVVFATKPGTVAPTVPVPPQRRLNVKLNPGDEVGPLCRRSLLALNRFDQSGQQQWTAGGFVHLITDASLDKQSPSSISYYEDDPAHAGKVIFFHRN